MGNPRVTQFSISWVRQFIDMQGLQVITALLKAFNKNKQRYLFQIALQIILKKIINFFFKARIESIRRR